MDSIAARLDLVEEKIENACRQSGRKRQEIKLVAVSKFHPIDAVEAAWQAGVRIFGESRVQEANDKFLGFWENHPHENAELHLIGSLQRNKAKIAVGMFDCIQSVDRDSLISALGALTMERQKPLMVLLEYHTGEETKSGFLSRDSLFRAAEKLMSFPGLKPAGLMTLAPFSSDKALVRSAFRELAAAQDELKKRFCTLDWSCLSMGMTNDFEVAIEEGSTMVRIGTAIFGERKT